LWSYKKGIKHPQHYSTIPESVDISLTILKNSEVSGWTQSLLAHHLTYILFTLVFALIYTAIQRIFLIIYNLVYFLTGILLGEVIKHEHVSKLHLTHYLGWSTLMFILVAVTYYTIIMIGLDPL
jgi:hypothetical protein